MVSFPQIFPPIPCMYPFSLPYVVSSKYRKEAFTLSQLLICRYDAHVSINMILPTSKDNKILPYACMARLYYNQKKGIITTNKNNLNVRLLVPAPTRDTDFDFAYNIRGRLKITDGPASSNLIHTGIDDIRPC
jgi:hypothetical protein